MAISKLTGSEKQIAWAEDIRAKLLPLLEAAATAQPKTSEESAPRRRTFERVVHSQDAVDAARSEIELAITQEESSFWIDAKNVFALTAANDWKNASCYLGLALVNNGGEADMFDDRKTKNAGAALLLLGMSEIGGEDLS